MPPGAASVCSEKMAALGEKSFCVLEYHTVSLWLLCNVHFVQSTNDLQEQLSSWTEIWLYLSNEVEKL